MAEEFSRSIKNISGVSSHINFRSAQASDIRFRMEAETVIIHSTCDTLYVMVRDTCLRVGKNSFLLIDPFTPYSVISNPEEAAQTYDLLSFRATTDPWDKSACFFFANGTVVIDRSHPSFERFSQAFANITGTVSKFPKDSQKPPFHSLLALHGYTELLASVMASELGWHELPSPVFEAWDIFENSIEFICENLGSDLSLDEISARSGLSTFYYSHKYKEIFGNTVMRDVNRMKLYKSVAMLIQSDASISDIALGCGFGSVATYCSVFKKFYTFTPMAMRRKKTLLRAHSQNQG
ncbi:MAG: helix-turn-helix transcriptional regulator [Clostridia bacterium]|nr:helix-turn-helix transcriptional regulator [Clostridia bacterium]